MKRQTMILAALAAITTTFPAIAQTTTGPTKSMPAAAPVKAYTTTETPISVILADPRAKAIMAKHLPKLAADERIEQAGSMTLAQVQPYAPDITPDVLAAIDADFAKLAAEK